ncbi:MAG: hypothetical protein M3362_22160, partial [Acidobacteriota bacterium]|nr:hypothetical protein [Acidobacteriota bacterium]
MFEHEPRELYISVNGIVQGSQKINSEYSELNLVIDLAETISFVEIRSEQGVRLLLLNAGGLPPRGPAEQRVGVELSDSRKLGLTLRFMSPWPTISVLYHDPAFRDTYEGNATAVVEPAHSASSSVSLQGFMEEHGKGTRAHRSGPLVSKLFRFFANWSFWLRPRTIAITFGLILISGLLFMQLRRVTPTPTSAAELLKKSAVAEETVASKPDIVLHRTISFEEKSPDGKLTAQRRIEVWQDAKKEIVARRLYDERGTLLAGDWRWANGMQMLYRPGIPPLLQHAPEKGSSFSMDFENVWQLNLSAKDFATLVGRTDRAQVEERPSEIVITYTEQASDDAHALRKGSLVIARADLHAIELVLLVQHGGELREYRFKESSFNQVPASQAPQSAFQPEPELVEPVGQERELKNKSGGLDANAPTVPESKTAPVVASADLEVEVMYLLHQIKADLGEQISVTRTRDGQLQVEGLVETEGRKTEIVRMLHPLVDNPAVKISIET